MHGKTILFVIGFAFGIMIGELSLYGTEAAVASLLLFLFQGAVYFFQKRKGEGLLFPLYVTLLCLGITLGVIRVQSLQEKTNFICTSCTFEAYIITSPQIKNQYQIFSVHSQGGALVRSIQVRAPLYPRMSVGEKIQLTGKVTEPKNITSTSSNQFDYISYLGTKDIGSEMFFPKVEVMDSESKSFISQLGEIKENFISRIEQYVRAPGSALSSGMLFGNSSMSSELSQTFCTAGLSHIVVLSGFNIAIVISAILLLFAFIPLVIRISLASIAVLLFVIMVGGEASVIRATVMAFIGLLAHLLGRHYVAKQALIISFFLIILFEPMSLLHDVSLHLSFLATAGIVYASEYLQKLFCRVTN
jgi:competence protein ComEC